MQGLVLLLFIPVFWLLIIRPQQQQRRGHQAVVASLEVGDRVMTVGGLIGTLTDVGTETVWVDLGDSVVELGRTFVRQRMDVPAVGKAPVDEGRTPSADGPPS